MVEGTRAMVKFYSCTTWPEVAEYINNYYVDFRAKYLRGKLTIRSKDYRIHVWHSPSLDWVVAELVGNHYDNPAYHDSLEDAMKDAAARI